MFVRPAGHKTPGWREVYNFTHVRSIEDAIVAATAQIADWNTRGESKRGRRNGMIERAREIVAVEFGGERRELA